MPNTIQGWCDSNNLRNSPNEYEFVGRVPVYAVQRLFHIARDLMR